MGRGGLTGARVLVRCYHGLGDTIQFARYLPLLAERAALVWVEAQPELIPLLRSLPAIVDLVPLGRQDHPPARFGCDAEIDITELPHAFRTDARHDPGRDPVSERRRRSGRRRRRGVSPQMPGRCARRTGLGRRSLEDRSARFRSTGFAARRIPGVALVNLQRGPEYRRWRECAGVRCR